VRRFEEKIRRLSSNDMKTSRIALIHATPVAIEPIGEAFRRLWPEAQTTNLLDDSLATDLSRDGCITQNMTGRFIDLARYVRGCGADAILFTCSAFGTAIEATRDALDVPVLKPNEAMLEEALAAGLRIGVIATFEPSIPSFRAELEALAKSKGVQVEIAIEAVPAALAALQAGDGDKHDRLIADRAVAMKDCDVILLSQFSMASAAAKIPATQTCKVLTSPASAVTRLRAVLGR
jgi:Asp/Glu/hydantoin racemase